MQSRPTNYCFIIGFGVLSATSLLIPNMALADDAVETATTDYASMAKQAEVRLNFAEAIAWYQRAAELGDAGSMYELGCIYFGFHDIPGRQLRDYSRATVWFQKAANLNYIPAITQLGVMYSQGKGVPKDIDEAVRWWRKAVEVDGAGASGRAAQSWLDLREGKPLCIYCDPSKT
jgi:TPR repeat protein